MKGLYVVPEMEIIKFSAADIIVTSLNTDGDNQGGGDSGGYEDGWDSETGDGWSNEDQGF